ncbi:MAG: hypothetical protein ACK5JF_02335 [Oscillospiraceae bacterium]
MIILNYLAIFSAIVAIVFAYAIGKTFINNPHHIATEYKFQKYGFDMPIKEFVVTVGVLAALALIVTIFLA